MTEELLVDVSEYLSIVVLAPEGTKKTGVGLVRSRSTGHELGQIRWFGQWRQYCFWPAPETIFNDGCLRHITRVCAGLTAAQRRAAKAGSPLTGVFLAEESRL
jgi:hypothetical protein